MDTPAAVQAKLVEFLSDEILRHHNLYEFGSPVISDADFDAIVQHLAALAPEHPTLQVIGGRPGKIAHLAPMLSLAKAYDSGEVENWLGERRDAQLVVTPKVDGLAVSLRYGPTGKLDLAATRGDGQSGLDVTYAVSRIPNIPKQLPHLRNVEVRGEVYLPKAELAGYAGHTSARNLAAGMLRSSKPTMHHADLRFAAYQLLGLPLEVKSTRLIVLRRLDFDVVPAWLGQWQDMRDAGSFEDMAVAVRDLPYDCDGMVLEFNDMPLQAMLGATAHHPRGMLAWKFAGASLLTKLREVVWQAAASGVITPVAVFDPVRIDGAVLTRATLHNLSTARRFDFRVDCDVQVSRRGGVIPQIDACLGGGYGPLLTTPPAHCPSCGSPTWIVVNGAVEVLRCRNHKSPSR